MASISFPRAAAADEVTRELYTRGTAAYALGHYAEAAALYEDAFTRSGDPVLLFDAAQAHRLGGDKRRALTLYRNYLKLYRDEIPNRAQVERQIEALTAALAAAPPPASAPAAASRAATANALLATPPPLRRRPWLWVVSGGAAVAVGLAVGLGVGLGARPSAPEVTIGVVKAN
jgi:tetratricopeptide (TPR) repeat protein